MFQPVTSKIQPDVSITDESFDSSYAHRYGLLLQITDDGLTFMVLNHSANKFIVLRDYKFDATEAYKKMEEIFSSTDYLSNVNYKTVTVSIATSKTTLVPAPFFNSNDSKKLLEFNHSLKPKDMIYSNYVRAFELNNVFAIREETDKLLKSKFSSFNLLHSATPFMEGVHLEHRNIALPGLFVNVVKKSFEVMVMNGKQLLFYNYFRYETPEDLAYYVLFVAEQLRLNPEVNTLTLTGNIQRESPLFTILYKYFRNVDFAERFEQYKYHFGFEKISSHTYFSVFSQALCE